MVMYTKAQMCVNRLINDYNIYANVYINAVMNYSDSNVYAFK